MKTKLSCREDFLNELDTILKKLRPHDFIDKKQAKYFNKLKNNRKDRDIKLFHENVNILSDCLVTEHIKKS